MIAIAYARNCAKLFPFVRQKGCCVMTDNFASDFYGLPTYIVDQVRLESIAETNQMRVYHWESLNGVLRPLFMAVLTTHKLARIGSEVRDHALQSLAGRAHH